jgi:hypothetical protein
LRYTLEQNRSTADLLARERDQKTIKMQPCELDSAYARQRKGYGVRQNCLVSGHVAVRNRCL